MRRAPAFLTLGDSEALVETQQLWALGFPAGWDLSTSRKGPAITVAGGRVTSLREDDLNRLAFIQFDAATSSGSSGGPVVDANGSVQGVHQSAVSETMKFAIPVNRLKALLVKAGLR